MKRLVYILFLCNGFFSYGQKGAKISVSNLPEPIKPGQHFSLFYVFSNKGSSDNDFQNRLVLPPNWKILTEKTLDSKESPSTKKYIYTISTPSQEVPDSYSIDFQIVAKGETIVNKTIRVRILAVRNLEVIPLSQPEFVKEGDELSIEYLIQNLGNRTERVKLETTKGTIENIKDSVDIKPNSSQKIVVKQAIPETDLASWQTSSDLRVSFPNQPIPIIQIVSVPVFSTKNKQNDPYLRLPIQIGGSVMNYTIGKQKTTAYQYHAEGKGFLDFSKKHYIDFILRGPNQIAFPTIGNYDQYSVSYNYLSKTEITAGDYILKLNNLIEFGRFGRGLKIEQSVGNATVMAFYQQARFFPSQKDAFGGSVKYKLKGESNIGLSFTAKNLIEGNAHFRSNLLGVSSFFKKNQFTNETEIALGHARDKFDIGIFNKLNFTYKRLAFNSEVIHTGKNFYGFYTNSILFANNVSYYLTKQLNFGINSNITKINPSLDVIKYTISPYSTTNMAFLSYQPNAKNLFFLNFTKQEREDRQKPSTFHYKEDFGNFSYNLNNQKFTLFVQGRYGFAQNLLAIDSTAKKRSTSYLVQPSVALLPWFWISGYLEHQHTSKFSANNDFQNLYYYGGSVRLNYKKNLSLNLSYRNNYAPDEFYEKRSFVDGSLVFESERHQLSINGGRVFIPNLTNNDQNTLFLTAKYLYKINVPLKKDKKLGHIKGQIISMSKGIKIDGILFQIGKNKVLSDRNGRFSFINLMPDKYFVTMSHESALAGVVSTRKMPMEVNIKADSTELVTIQLVKAGGVIGTVNFENIENAPPSVKPIVYIKLYNDKESFLTQINDKNEFSFKEMKPGAWKLKAIVAGKTEQFDILNPEQEIEIESNKIKKAAFTVKTIERKVQFSGKNFHLSSQK